MEQHFKVGFIASTQQFIDCALAVARKRKLDVVTSLTGLDAAVPAGQKMEEEGVEVIISRRGTALMLRKSLKIPVLSVRMSSHDILRNIRDASLLGQKILLTSLGDEIGDIGLLQDIFKVPIIPGIFHDFRSLENAIINGKRQGCEVVIGGGISVALARKHKLKAVEIRTNEDAIQAALDDAGTVVRANREEQEKTLRYRTIMDTTSEGIIAVDKNGVITAINRTARKFFGLTQIPIEGKSFFTLLPGDSLRESLNSGRPLFNKLEKFGHEQFVTNYIPLIVGNEVVGLVITFRDLPDVVRAENEVRRCLVKRLAPKYTIEDFIHHHPRMREVVEKARKFARSDSTVLITGETGTGKEILAQGIHTLGPRRNGPFISINCAALPDQLLESELFGHEEGAFTGSRRGGKVGLFELAHNGTIFLDEIGATTPNLQNRLLRVLQEREVMRVGGDRLIPVNVRIIAATNQNLGLEVQKGNFREDLYFRLAVLTIYIPPLRERLEDLPVLVEHLITRCICQGQKSLLTIPAKYIERLMAYHWPGNVRQLQNFLEKLVILCEGNFQANIFEELYAELLTFSSNAKGDRGHTEEIEYIKKVLEESQFSKKLAAQRLGMSRTTLWRKMREMELNSSDSRS